MAVNNGRSRETRQPADGRLRNVVREAVSQFVELSGSEPERVCGVRSTDNGWSVLVDVLDLERVPSTTSVMSTFRIDVDSDGQITGYERLRRFTRAATDH